MQKISLVITHRSWLLTFCTENSAVLKGLTLWLGQWEAYGWIIINKPFGGRIYRKTFGFACQNLSQLSLISIYQIMRHWYPLAAWSWHPSPGTSLSNLPFSRYSIQRVATIVFEGDGIWPRLLECPWNKMTWLMQLLCVLNKAQGNCQRSVSPFTGAPHWWVNESKMIISAPFLRVRVLNVFVWVDTVSGLI